MTGTRCTDAGTGTSRYRLLLALLPSMAVAMTMPFTPTAAEAGATSVLEALFGDEASRRAFARQSLSLRQVTEDLGISPSDRRATELTYGEFSSDFFFELLQLAAPVAGERFCDVGSGCGRLVLAAALTQPWELASGVELLPSLHSIAIDSHAQLSTLVEGEDDLPALAPCEFVCGEADDELPRLLGCPARHVVFVYATAWRSTGPLLTELSRTLGRSLPVGSRVITIDKQLVSDDSANAEWAFELLHPPVERSNYNTFSSVGYVYERVDGGCGGGERKRMIS